MHLDLKVGRAVAIDVAFHHGEARLRHEMQLARLMVKGLAADELKTLILRQIAVRVHVAEVDVIGKVGEIDDDVAGPSLRLSCKELKTKMWASAPPISVSAPLPPVSLSLPAPPF